MKKPTYEELVTAMEEYGRHTANCRIIQALHKGIVGGSKGCDCGYEWFMSSIENKELEASGE